MQERQKNRKLYFEELSTTSKKFYIPYISKFKKIEEGMNILEIGCGDGGNLLPFAELGCSTTGVDISAGRIKDAILFFAEKQIKGNFIASDIFKLKSLEHNFDLIICHDVIEHIEDKATFLFNLPKYTKPGGLIFMSFPAWQMPFGGHQQICKSKTISHVPFIHLLPAFMYKSILKMSGENEDCIKELLSIKKTRTPIELFEKLVHKNFITIADRQLFFINPHYEIKFGLTPRKLSAIIAGIPYLRNFFTTSCFYILI
ncbi:class I SAM-dependent methyltransferase [Bacteroides cellulosilyticus]|uniref:class I SAM-dependent methyltransferase n=1 Tax=Bacteroides cellulosilyticus TaxID=246787 RepID=UPI001C37B6D6|nr:methyltransferase domain-containing protein [Bacteroides cellulosilyticus]MBV3637811.1 methyltransferase domain-containing protein [Bacteroides cellulosilyticus]MBV3664152.1 methyltransferase domain-containing protein [Bacteroides cellulosilyticus]MBV3686053.1 methyltransferase domain-containing protein [Bacteroides cellulosilyticus]MBV3696480.1 methyltransferase domain-containing protein [Bacteroides cellulosilyticus]MBV3708350.1 methyltransferase domain-containing protein [Bacteroides cel